LATGSETWEWWCFWCFRGGEGLDSVRLPVFWCRCCLRRCLTAGKLATEDDLLDSLSELEEELDVDELLEEEVEGALALCLVFPFFLPLGRCLRRSFSDPFVFGLDLGIFTSGFKHGTSLPKTGAFLEEKGLKLDSNVWHTHWLI